MRNAEQHEIAGFMADALGACTAEGAVRRAAGTKRHWKQDPNHLAAAGRHWDKYHAGERYDEEGIHHLVKVAWRCLAWAYPEMVEDGLIPPDPLATNSPPIPELHTRSDLPVTVAAGDELDAVEALAKALYRGTWAECPDKDAWRERAAALIHAEETK